MSESQEVDRLKRTLARETAAREEAEQLLEQRSSELFSAYTDLQRELSRVKSLEAAINTSTDGIAYTDSDGRFLYMNTAHAELFGYSAEELIGELWSILYKPDELQRFDSEIMPIFGRDGFWRGEAVGAAKNGEPVHQEINLAALPNGGIICTTRDIFERQRREKLARETSALISADEQRAQVNSIVAAVAHDFNNLVSAINGYAELLLMEVAGDPKLRDRAHSIKSAADQAASIVSSLEHVDQTEHVDFDLVATVNECLAIVDVLRPSTVAVEKTLPPRARISGEPTLISRAILNILKNSFEAMTSGGHVEVVLEHAATPMQTADGQHVFRMGHDLAAPVWRLRLSDDGPGIPSADLHRIFDVGFSTKDRVHNSGLGMSSLVTMQDAHEVTVTVMTGEGAGTEFVFEFADLLGRSIADDYPQHTKGRKILVVDDNVAAGQALCSLLEHMGYAVEFQESPIKALGRVRDADTELGLVISDFDMPDIDGVQMARLLAQDYPDIPVLIYSGRKVRASGSDNIIGFLKKPVGRDGLVEVLPFSPPDRSGDPQ